MRNQVNKNWIPLFLLSLLIMVTANSSIRAEEAIFPYFATGGGWQAVLMLVNDSAEPVTARLVIGGSKGRGTLSGLLLDGRNSGPNIDFTLAGGETVRTVIGSASPELQTGFLVIETSRRIHCALFFEARAGSQIREAVGILPIRSISNSRIIPVHVEAGRNIALALLPEALTIEPSILFDPAAYLPAQIKLTLYSTNGTVFRERTLSVSEIYSRFVTEIFSLPSEFLGYLRVEGISSYSSPLVTALFFEWRSVGWELTSLAGD